MAMSKSPNPMLKNIAPSKRKVDSSVIPPKRIPELAEAKPTSSVNEKPKAVDERISKDELAEFRAMASKLGFDVKRTVKYTKHTYEIEESVHNSFHENWRLWGYKSVKEAATEAFRLMIEAEAKIHGSRRDD